MKKNEAVKPKSMNIFLVLALILISFFTGYLWFKLQSLKQGSNQAAAPQQAPQNLDAMPKVTDKDHIRGSKDAEVILVEYGDFECPFCKKFQPTLQQVIKEYGSKVAWVYRHYPLSFHQNAQKEAEASECVAELGGNEKFWEFADKIYEKTTSNGTGFPLDGLAPLAQEVGVDTGSFQTCLDSGRYTKLVKDQFDTGSKAGVNGTPGTILVKRGGKKDFINGALPYEQVKQQIDALLK